jgi:hypothetical protein
VSLSYLVEAHGNGPADIDYDDAIRALDKERGWVGWVAVKRWPWTGENAITVAFSTTVGLPGQFPGHHETEAALASGTSRILRALGWTYIEVGVTCLDTADCYVLRDESETPHLTAEGSPSP